MVFFYSHEEVLQTFNLSFLFGKDFLDNSIMLKFSKSYNGNCLKVIVVAILTSEKC